MASHPVTFNANCYFLGSMPSVRTSNPSYLAADVG